MQTQTSKRILRIRDVVAETGLSRTTIWRLARNGEFPAALQLSERAIGWKADEVRAWVESRERSVDAPLPVAA